MHNYLIFRKKNSLKSAQSKVLEDFNEILVTYVKMPGIA